MCLSKKSFDVMDRKKSVEGKQLAEIAVKAFNSLNFHSSEEEVKSAKQARKAYLEYVYQEKLLHEAE